VIHGEIRRHLRARRDISTVGDEPSAEIPAPESGLEGADDRVLLSRSVEALSDVEQRIVFLRFQADMTERQIAASVGLSQAQVSRNLARALKKLRAELSDPEAEVRDPAAAPASGDIAAKSVVSPENGATERAGRPKPGQARHPAESVRTTIAGMESQERKPGRGYRLGRSQEQHEKSAATPPAYSGRFLVRLPSDLHEELTMAARREQVSLNRLVTDTLAASMAAPLDRAPIKADHASASAEPPGPARSRRAMRVVMATNLVLVALTTAVAIILLVLAVERGI
jgi:predicted DNA-binding protein (UPF0251 family)